MSTTPANGLRCRMPQALGANRAWSSIRRSTSSDTGSAVNFRVAGVVRIAS
jgi:hypothetical protein